MSHLTPGHWRDRAQKGSYFLGLAVACFKGAWWSFVRRVPKEKSFWCDHPADKQTVKMFRISNTVYGCIWCENCQSTNGTIRELDLP